ncbi:MAG: hypothetical protein MJB57_01705, partial [Gemmatimonadetes bacterium]|nr:hypothetical protein [Gemmatimonadota bacterium]
MPTRAESDRTLLDEAATHELIVQLSRTIDRAVSSDARLVLVGIHRRGDVIAGAIADRLEGSRG